MRSFLAASLWPSCSSTTDRGELPVLADPFIIITALPAALAGIVWMLFLTHTTLSFRRSRARSCAWAGDGELHSCVSLSPERLAEHDTAVSVPRSRPDWPYPSGADDGTGDDDRHDADVGLGKHEQNAPLGALSSAACCSRPSPRCCSCLACSRSCTTATPNGRPVHDGAPDNRTPSGRRAAKSKRRSKMRGRSR